MRRRDVWAATAIVLAVVVGAGLLSDDAFYAAVHIAPADAGMGLLRRLLRGVVGAVVLSVIALALLVALAGARWVLGHVRRLRSTRGGVVEAADPVGAVVVLLGVAGLIVVVRALGFQIDFWSFVSGRAPRLLEAGIAAFAGLTLAAAVLRRRVCRSRLGPGYTLALAGIVLVAAPGLALAAQWGRYVGAEVAKGDTLRANLLFPTTLAAFNWDARFVCLGHGTAGDPDGLYVRLGANRQVTVLLDHLGVHRVATAAIVLTAADGPMADCPGPTAPPPISAAEAAALAFRFRPFLRFDSREPWRPLEIGRFLDETFPPDGERHQICVSGRCAPLSSPPRLPPVPRAALDIHGSGTAEASPDPTCRVGILKDCDTGPRSAIYYHVTAGVSDKLYIDYWWFERYNHFPYPERAGDVCGGRGVFDEHEGDWEGVTVTLSRKTRSLIGVAYSAHGTAFDYQQLSPELVQGRPVVYLACGSHAAYPAPCAAHCHQTQADCHIEPCAQTVSGRTDGDFDGASPWGRNSDAACSAAPPCLLALPQASLAAAGAPTELPFTTWQGRWGVPGGPKSPGLQTPYQFPSDQEPTNRVRF